MPPLREGDGPEVLVLRGPVRTGSPVTIWWPGLVRTRWWLTLLTVACALAFIWPGLVTNGRELGAQLGIHLLDARRGGFEPGEVSRFHQALASAPAPAQAMFRYSAYRLLDLLFPVLYAMASLAWLAHALGRRKMPAWVLALPILVLVADQAENLWLCWDVWFSPLSHWQAEAASWANRLKWWLILAMLLSLSAVPVLPRHDRRRLDQILR